MLFFVVVTTRTSLSVVNILYMYVCIFARLATIKCKKGITDANLCYFIFHSFYLRFAILRI